MPAAKETGKQFRPARCLDSSRLQSKRSFDIAEGHNVPACVRTADSETLRSFPVLNL